MPNVYTRNSELAGNLMPEFWSRKDAIIALSNAMNMSRAFMGARAFWPMSITTPAGLVSDVIDPVGGGNLTVTAGAALSNWNNYVPHLSLNGAGHATVATTANFLIATAMTVGAWVYATTNPGGAIGIIGRWRSAGANERSYLIYQVGTTLNFNVSTDGIAEVTSGAANISLNRWNRVVGRFIPGSSVSIFLNGRLASQNTTAIPATIFVGGAHPFRIGSYNNPAAYFTGAIGFPFFAATAISDEAIFVDYESTRAMYGV